ncbi:PREDICTED: gamma-glutamyl hydrolase-like, partial [Rhagoletis zephyria]|uniref:gamma-glutamyl hydrolase-like n=1 Tax=Rhagoletis zephyria TaxID=28612 RepID=UPI00081134E0
MCALERQKHCANCLVNNRPVLGVLLLENADKSGQFIGASYVKFLESAGARVVPIFLKQKQSYYQEMVSSLNGILMPGGSNSVTHSDFAQAADYLIEAAVQANTNGTHFPLWGTCLSFQKLISHFTGNNVAWMSFCDIENVALNLDIDSKQLSQYKLFSWAAESGRIVEILNRSPVTANYHKWCLNVTEFENNKNISDNFRKLIIGLCAYAAYAQDLDEAASEMDLDMAASGGAGAAAGAAGAAGAKFAKGGAAGAAAKGGAFGA